MRPTSEKPLIGISQCLLGEAVRHNGGHKRDDWLVEDLGPLVKWHPVCPEVAMGLGVPRESMRLARKAKKGPIHLLGNLTQTDLTEKAEVTSSAIVKKLPKNLNGFIFKNSSPSCGLERVKVYDINGAPFREGTGFFAREFVKAFPDVPVIEEGMLNNLHFREHFVTRVFAHFRVNELPAQMKDIQAFHQRYKFILLAHHERLMRDLGRIAANGEKRKPSEALALYKEKFLEAMAVPADAKKRTNAIQHIYGFVKDDLNAKEKNSVLKKLESYRVGKLPYAAIATLLQHLIEKSDNEYIKKQDFLSPYPEVLELKNGL